MNYSTSYCHFNRLWIYGIYVCMYVRTYVCMYGRMYVRMHVCVYVCMYVCTYICMLRAVDQKHLESFEMWCWKRMEKISWTDYVRNEEVLLRVKEQRNILHEIRKRKANWIGHILRRNCLLQLVIEGKIQGG